MSNRRRRAREILEIYLVHLFLAYRYLILISGLLLMVCAIAILYTDITAGILAMLPAVFLLLLSSSYTVSLYTARVCAWIGTLGRNDD